MRIIIMRHGEAIIADGDRVLSSRGKEEVLENARVLCEEYHLDVVVSSPKTRALQTAEIVITESGLDLNREVCDALTPSGDCEEVMDYVNSICTEYQTVLLVSHLPLVQYLAEYLKRTRIGQIPNFVTGSALILKLEGDNAQLEGFISGGVFKKY
ncbi:MAG: phosphohistidine phosphatase SixA [Succinivibrio sp.]|nr:phosphohistidine phosphatase SixA [Succinivibrio sp.]